MPLDVTKGSISLDFAERVAAGALAEDVEGDTISAVLTNLEISGWRGQTLVAADSEISLALKTLVFDATSLAFAAGFFSGGEATAAKGLILRLYMGGVLMQSTAELPLDTTQTLTYVLRDFKVLSGSQNCELKAYSTLAVFIRFYASTNISIQPCAIAVGSVKLA